MNNTINLNHTVYELCSKHPEMTEVMKELGFVDIVKPGMLQTAGRFMTLPKGAAMRGIDLSDIITRLQEKGYHVIEQEEKQ